MHPSVMKELNYMLLGAFPGGTSGKKNKKTNKQKKKTLLPMQETDAGSIPGLGRFLWRKAW